MDAGNISGWASGDIRESLEEARAKTGETSSEYIVEAVRRRLESENMLPEHRLANRPLDVMLTEAKATADMVSIEEIRLALHLLRERAAAAKKRGEPARKGKATT